MGFTKGAFYYLTGDTDIFYNKRQPVGDKLSPTKNVVVEVGGVECWCVQELRESNFTKWIAGSCDFAQDKLRPQ